MSSPENDNAGPDPQRLGRTSHLRILTVNLNTVRHPQEGPTGTPIDWSRPNGEQHRAHFEYQKPELEPVVLNGERVEWINPTKQACTIAFDEDECPESPFEDGKRHFAILPGQSVLSGVIKGKMNKHYPYLVNFAAPTGDGDGGTRGNPVIIVKG